MDYYITAIIGIITFCLAVYLLLKKTTWFHRSEIEKSNQPREGDSNSTPLSVLDYYTEWGTHYELFHHDDENYDEVIFYLSSGSGVKQAFHLHVKQGFLKKSSRRNVAQTFKLLGYIDRMIHPNVIVKFLRPGVSYVSSLIRGRLFIAYLITTALMSIPLNESLAFFTEFSGFFIMLGLFFYAIYFVKELIAYVLQNIYSLKLAKSFGVTQDECKIIFIYLWLSFLLFLITQVIKWGIIVILMFFILVLYN
ncbi:hypothetical protein HUG15_07510 [Salicibibacter cibarius]|uniref:Uncharacterized protein n=1 Tax=Salicibibacter cibarius TaxID=2743000 RepID=A0A7T6Z233_9BACI|nr:hypothetical protein [Salicibibacter cibarius]QQK75442.1 hypothetical protein HUG15_07510 [Salicibibacter cibarius]